MDVIVFDLETALIRDGVQAPPITCVAWTDGERSGLLHVSEARPHIAAWLDSAHMLVGHAIDYDLACVCAEWPELTPAVFAKYARDQVTCTREREQLTDLAVGQYRAGGRGYNLDEICERRFKVKLDKDPAVRLAYGPLRDVPIADWTQRQRDYPMQDVAWTRALYREQIEWPDQYRRARAAFWQRLMSAWGITLDQDRVTALESKLVAEREALFARLRVAGLVRADGTRDTKACALRMQATGQFSTTPTGGVSLAADDLEASGDPLLAAYARYSSINGKQLATDIPLLKSPVIHARYLLAETGRTRTRPNVQNWPRYSGMRECVTARPGNVLIVADYSGFELRTWAQVCLTLLGHSAQAEEIKRGLDPHVVIASQLLGTAYDAALAGCKAKDRACDDARQVGKVANFGLPGGMGVERFVDYARSQYGVTVTRDRGDLIKRTWRQARPEHARYFGLVNEIVSANRPITQLFSGRVRGGLGFCDGCNTLFQGLAADAACDAGFALARECYAGSGVLAGVRPIIFAHDEFVCEAPIDSAPEAAEALSRVMVDSAQRWLPDLPVAAEPLVSSVWSKKAKPVRDAGGRLVPWSS